MDSKTYSYRTSIFPLLTSSSLPQHSFRKFRNGLIFVVTKYSTFWLFSSEIHVLLESSTGVLLSFCRREVKRDPTDTGPRTQRLTPYYLKTTGHWNNTQKRVSQNFTILSHISQSLELKMRVRWISNKTFELVQFIWTEVEMRYLIRYQLQDSNLQRLLLFIPTTLDGTGKVPVILPVVRPLTLSRDFNTSLDTFWHTTISRRTPTTWHWGSCQLLSTLLTTTQYPIHDEVPYTYIQPVSGWGWEMSKRDTYRLNKTLKDETRTEFGSLVHKSSGRDRCRRDGPTRVRWRFERQKK